MYLMCLLISRKVGGGTKEGLEEELKKVREDEGEREKYEMMGNLSNVQQLLRITENPGENQNEEKTAIEEPK